MRPSVHPSFRPTIHPSICQSAYLFIYIDFYLSIYIHTYLSSYLLIYIHIYIYIYIYIYIFISNSLRWPSYVINWVDNSKLPCYTIPPTQHHSLFRSLPPLFFCLSLSLFVCLYHIDKTTSLTFPSPLGSWCSVNRRQLRFIWNWESYQWLNYLLQLNGPVASGKKQLCQKI